MFSFCTKTVSLLLAYSPIKRLVIHLNYSKTENLSAYFQAIEGRLKEILPDRASVVAQIAGYTVRLIFPNIDYSRYVVPDMFVLPDNGTETVDATFIWWEDRILPYQLRDFSHWKSFKHLEFAAQKGVEVFSVEDSYGYIEIVGDTLRAADYQKSNYYLMTYPTLQLKWPIAYHPFAKALFLWSQKHGLLMLHGAAVGINGHGVLIVGHGGTGKSTLTCSCLADKFDFISDDCCLLSASNRRTVYPIYTNISLNPDSLDMLPMFKPFEILPMQSEKRSFSVSEKVITGSLAVEAIVLPQITENTEPEIQPDKSSKALAQIVYSTTWQFGRFQETEFVRKLSQRLLGMPVYRFSLTKDLQKNCRYLREWIREELSCTN